MQIRTLATIFAGLMFFSLLIIFICIPKTAQWIGYHQFADVRTIWGIPNFWNVVSNIPFFVVGLLGCCLLRKKWNNKQIEIRQAIVFFIFFMGVFLTGIGSFYYHLTPNNTTLVWDRIPMTMVFMSLLSFTVMEKINLKWGFRLLIPLILFGFFSVFYWHQTELQNQGDLRLYGVVQFYSILMIIFILCFFHSTYPAFKNYFAMFVLYALAKCFEYFDHEIYNLNGMISGHTLKHLCAAISTYFMVIILKEYPSKHRG